MHHYAFSAKNLSAYLESLEHPYDNNDNNDKSDNCRFVGNVRVLVSLPMITTCLMKVFTLNYAYIELTLILNFLQNI